MYGFLLVRFILGEIGAHFEFLIMSGKRAYFKVDRGEEFCYWAKSKVSARTGIVFIPEIFF